MPSKRNPLNLNPLQLKTLTLLQELARSPETSTQLGDSGEVRIANFPHPHGNHFHLGGAVASAKDASGLRNEAVWRALEHKGLVRSFFPVAVVLTKDGLAYETHLRDSMLARAEH